MLVSSRRLPMLLLSPNGPLGQSDITHLTSPKPISGPLVCQCTPLFGERSLRMTYSIRVLPPKDRIAPLERHVVLEPTYVT
jgi:hypothetical protein